MKRIKCDMVSSNFDASAIHISFSPPAIILANNARPSLVSAGCSGCRLNPCRGRTASDLRLKNSLEVNECDRFVRILSV